MGLRMGWVLMVCVGKGVESVVAKGIREEGVDKTVGVDILFECFLR